MNSDCLVCDRVLYLSRRATPFLVTDLHNFRTGDSYASVVLEISQTLLNYYLVLHTLRIGELFHLLWIYSSHEGCHTLCHAGKNADRHKYSLGTKQLGNPISNLLLNVPYPCSGPVRFISRGSHLVP